MEYVVIGVRRVPGFEKAYQDLENPACGLSDVQPCPSDHFLLSRLLEDTANEHFRQLSLRGHHTLQ